VPFFFELALMTTIDFYFNTADVNALVLNLSQRAINQHRQVTLAVNDMTEAEKLSQVLWQANPTSFLPNCLISDLQAAQSPIVIAWPEQTHLQDDILINVSQFQPANFSRFKRLIEVVTDVEHDKSVARQRYVFYRDRGYTIKHVDMLKESI
jgi:DNA polymerase III subunit chi